MCSENMHQIYRSCFCNSMEIALGHGCSPVNFMDIFKKPISKNTSEGVSKNTISKPISKNTSEGLLLTL